ncbi:MAG: isoamylase early set domain-containing protein [Chitinophagales bacterium]
MSLKKQFLKSKPVCKVTFNLPKEAAVEAESVKLLGDFNEWEQASAIAMTPLKNGSFKTTLDLEAGKEYQFLYLIDDNKWEKDLEADKYELSPFGTENSVVVC